MQMNHVSLILKLQEGKTVFFYYFFFMPLERLVLFKLFYFDPPLLLISPRTWISLVLLLALLVLMEH